MTTVTGWIMCQGFIRCVIRYGALVGVEGLVSVQEVSGGYMSVDVLL